MVKPRPRLVVWAIVSPVCVVSEAAVVVVVVVVVAAVVVDVPVTVCVPVVSPATVMDVVVSVDPAVKSRVVKLLPVVLGVVEKAEVVSSAVVAMVVAGVVDVSVVNEVEPDKVVRLGSCVVSTGLSLRPRCRDEVIAGIRKLKPVRCTMPLATREHVGVTSNIPGCNSALQEAARG